MKVPTRGKKLVTELSDRLCQLRARKQGLIYYIENPNPTLSNKSFSENDLIEVEKQIQETQLAIEVLQLYESGKLNAVLIKELMARCATQEVILSRCKSFLEGVEVTYYSEIQNKAFLLSAIQNVKL